LSDRAGYDSRFLGEGEELEVPLPLLSAAMEKKAAEVSGATSDEEKYLLNYTNYSVVMNKERRMAFYTATNIDGEQWKSVKRKKDAWFYDPRIDRAAQVGEELYRDNDLDRGHLTRRLDPAWGAQYLQGEQDTFFFTNCTPQHHEFNTKTWLGLEDYLLSSADTRDFKACIFTGPIFGAKDHPYTFPLKKGETDNILIPLQYWKVAVMVRAETGALSATAYIISQADLISNLEFVFGQFKTYQVTVAKIKKLTGLDFGALQSYDPLGHVEGIAERELTAMSDIVI
jgi:endonuclease G